jgi:DNA-binding response OmpR family regulator
MRPNTRVLIIHSDECLRRELANVLAEEGCRTFEAQSHVLGLALLGQVKPELIFLHVTSDHEHGWAAFSQIRLLTNVPTVLLADETPLFTFRALCKRDNAVLVVSPFQLANVVAEASRLCHDQANLASPESENHGDGGVARALPRALWHAIDRALWENGDGEVRLIVQRGRLRFLERLKTIRLDIEPVVT